ncbi:MAG: ferredoxin [Planctomycetota bacterium]
MWRAISQQREIPMPSWPDRHPQNAPGAFYVDSQCTDCSLCQDTEPTVFRRDDEHGYAYVAAQPQTPEELRLAAQAAEECPCNAIGSDGKPADPSFGDRLKAAGLPEDLSSRSRHPAGGCGCHKPRSERAGCLGSLMRKISGTPSGTNPY